MTPTDVELSALAAQWVGAIATAVGAIVAGVFGWITLATSRRSKDTQERATLTAAEPISADFVEAVAAVSQVNWRVDHAGGETWLLVNTGGSTAHDVTLAGMTKLDQQRLTVGPEARVVGPTAHIDFVLVSRYTLSGPANLVVSFALEPGGPQMRRVVRVPAL